MRYVSGFVSLPHLLVSVTPQYSRSGRKLKGRGNMVCILVCVCVVTSALHPALPHAFSSLEGRREGWEGQLMEEAAQQPTAETQERI